MAALAQALVPGSRERLFAIIRFYGLGNLESEHGGAVDPLLDAAAWARAELGANAGVFRPRKDELAVLFECPVGLAVRIADALTAGLNDLSPSLDFRTDVGFAILPEEVDSPIAALKRANNRLVPADPEPDRVHERRRRRAVLAEWANLTDSQIR